MEVMEFIYEVVLFGEMDLGSPYLFMGAGLRLPDIGYLARAIDPSKP